MSQASLNLSSGHIISPAWVKSSGPVFSRWYRVKQPGDDGLFNLELYAIAIQRCSFFQSNLRQRLVIIGKRLDLF